MIKYYLLFLLFLFCNNATAQTATKGQRVLIALDGSLKMQRQWDQNSTAFKAATQFINRLLDSVYETNDKVEFALRVYGHQYPASEKNCIDSKLEVMFSGDNRTQMQLRLANLYPTGISSLAFALKEIADEDVTNGNAYNYDLIIITNGEASCDENICSIYQNLLSNKFAHKPYIIALSDDPALENKYTCIGSYLPVNRETDVVTAIDSIRNRYKVAHIAGWDDKGNTKPAIVSSPLTNDTITLYTPHATADTIDVTHPISLMDSLDDNTYLLFTSKFMVSGLSLFYQYYNKYVPVSQPVFILPMKQKQLMKSGRYRVLYKVTVAGKIMNRVKEFYIRLHSNNVVDLY